MMVIKVEDLSNEEAFHFLKRKRAKFEEPDEVLRNAQKRVGGRLRHLKMIADHRHLERMIFFYQFPLNFSSDKVP